MIKNLSFLTIFLLSYMAFSQACVVNETQAPFLADPVGAYEMQIVDNLVSLDFSEDYDTLTAFPNAFEGSVYEAVVGIRVPNDTSFVYDLGSGPQLFEDVQLNSISVNSVVVTESTSGLVDETGSPDELLADGSENPDYNPNYGALILPPGFSWECVGGDGGDACEWSGGDYGCLRFGFDEPIAAGNVGAYRINVLLDVSATYSFSGIPIPIDLTVDDLLNYYVLVVDEEQSSSNSEITSLQGFQLIGSFPNPATDHVNVQYGNDKFEEISIKLYDILGNVVMLKETQSNIGFNEFIIDTNNLLSGMYTVVVSNHNGHMIDRIIVQ